MQNKEILIAYCAGFFDGEGSILINRANQTNNRSSFGFSLQIDVSQISDIPLTIFQKIWGGEIYKYAQKNKSAIYKLRYSGKSAGFVLKDMLPYLSLKKDEATVAIEFISIKKIGEKLTFETKQQYREKLQKIRETRKSGK